MAGQLSWDPCGYICKLFITNALRKSSKLLHFTILDVPYCNSTLHCLSEVMVAQFAPFSVADVLVVSLTESIVF